MSGRRDGATPGITRLVLLRHGDCEQTAEKPDPALSGLGQLQCACLRDRLARSGELSRVSALISSPLRRARETAKVVADAVDILPGAIRVRDDLREMSWGKADGWRWDELTNAYGEPAGPDAVFADGESWAGFVRRAGAALTGVASEHAGTDVLIVCHTGIIEVSFIVFGLLGKRADRFQMKPLNAALTSWVSVDGADDAGWRLERYNDAAHLWRDGQWLHRHDDYTDMRSLGDPFWDAVGRESAVSAARAAY
jgi:2,3-bisphosphoglycerate-dependent phosphoglycerate mutase